MFRNFITTINLYAYFCFRVSLSPNRIAQCRFKGNSLDFLGNTMHKTYSCTRALAYLRTSVCTRTILTVIFRCKVKWSLVKGESDLMESALEPGLVDEQKERGDEYGGDKGGI